MTLQMGWLLFLNLVALPPFLAQAVGLQVRRATEALQYGSEGAWYHDQGRWDSRDASWNKLLV
jgi:hypothetical protein